MILHMMHKCDYVDWDEGQAQRSGQAHGVFSFLGGPQCLDRFLC